MNDAKYIIQTSFIAIRRDVTRGRGRCLWARSILLTLVIPLGSAFLPQCCQQWAQRRIIACTAKFIITDEVTVACSFVPADVKTSPLKAAPVSKLRQFSILKVNDGISPLNCSRSRRRFSAQMRKQLWCAKSKRQQTPAAKCEK
jgi:hypothetical protein